jgi:acyl-CoA thioester hydrolase
MIELWKGSCNQWDCDEMGHMNVRVYIEKQMEGLAVFAAAIGLPGVFGPRSTSTLRPIDQHIRFMAEALPGKPLQMVGGVLEIGDSDAVIYQEIRHGDGRIAAAFRTRIVHVDTAESERFRWPRRAREALQRYAISPPAETLPRSLKADAQGLAVADITLARVQAHGVAQIGLGAVPMAHLDAFGLLQPQWFIGRISDSVPNLLYAWRRSLAGADGQQRIGAAVLEYRLRYHRYPAAGDIMAVYSSFGRADAKTHSLVHWIMDPVTGQPWATTEAVAITLDLDARKAIAAPAERLAELEQIAPRGLLI